MTDFPDEFGPYLDEALQDPEFRKAYESAQKEEGVTEEWKPPTVGDLVTKLSTLDQTLPVVVAKDEEGNGFEYWSGDVVESLIDKTHRDATYHTPEQWAEEMKDPDSRFDPVDDEPPEIGGDIERVIVVWP